VHPLDVWPARDAEAQSFARFRCTNTAHNRPHVGLNHSTKISLARINFLCDATCIWLEPSIFAPEMLTKIAKQTKWSR